MRTVVLVASAAAVAVTVYHLFAERRRRNELKASTNKATSVTPEADRVTSQKPCLNGTPATDEGTRRLIRGPLRYRFASVSDDCTGTSSAAGEGGVSEFSDTCHKLRQNNKQVVHQWERSEWGKAKQRIEAAGAKIEAAEAAGIADPVRQRSMQLLAERNAGTLEQRAGQDEAEAGGRPMTAAAEVNGEARAPLLGSTAASLAAELQRWPRPPAGSGCDGALEPHTWPLYYDHFDWLDEVATTYHFADAGEVLRHLVFVANGESSQVKKLIFKVIRCLHCHTGTRAGYIPKKDKELGLFDFQMKWLVAVQKQCSHPSVEKSVRVLCDYYRKVTSDSPGGWSAIAATRASHSLPLPECLSRNLSSLAPSLHLCRASGAEAELFWRNRKDVTRNERSGTFAAHIPGVPGNHVLGGEDGVYVGGRKALGM
jgi:hypothetical protein